MEDKPDWWNEREAHFRINEHQDKRFKRLAMVNTLSDTMTIQKHRQVSDEWEVSITKHLPNPFGLMNFIIYFSVREIEQMFGISNRASFDKEWLQRFGAESGGEGRYIRKGNFLNLPNPSVSKRADLNLSILVTPELQEAIGNLLHK